MLKNRAIMNQQNKSSVHFYEPQIQKDNDNIPENSEIYQSSQVATIVTNPPKLNTFITQHSNSVFDSKSVKNLSKYKKFPKSVSNRPKLHLTTERKRFIDSISRKNFYREKSLKLQKSLDLVLKVSSVNLMERPEENYEAGRINPTSQYQRQTTAQKLNIVGEVCSSVTFHERLPSGEFMTK